MSLKCVPPAPWTWTRQEDTWCECFCATGTEPHEKEHKSQESPGAAAASCRASPEPQLPPPVTPLSPQPGPGKHPLLCLHIFWPLRVSKSFADMTLSHLVWANILLLLFKGVMQTVDLLGLDTHLDGFGCEGVFDLHGVRCRLTLPTTRPSAFRAACASASSSR